MNEFERLGNVRFSEFAIGDLDSIFDYSAEFDVSVGSKFIRNLFKTFKNIGVNPYIGTAKDELRRGIRMFPFNRLNIYYFVEGKSIEIFRIIHSSRDIVQIFEDIGDRPN